ncbi:NAD(P)/FAD-dependent oxidoreductase [Atlantibacter subterranea]|uniref:NAD(P)/FAD-dependent oxidoreductase n=1 Tax=Atlantibacter subterraneus TaxID=255519 RepID=A0ABU4DXC2_9ENTR|nr:NAD(P)/FAD-dependent oxidoreductase [Atlantibacter subterranea]MDV7021510.1 NAD(P)/FAD-dependent oxidoreductase [Atlantibacter subterranea]MDZ5664392.1 NAD(P)/FAD-dependent oxidoreductase [Atlantibacter hermannii]
MTENMKDVIIVGGGFTGLTAALELLKRGYSVTVLESESEIGGLAGAFKVGGQKLDKFYHHWFTNDLEVMELIDELGLTKELIINPTNTGMYYANNFFKLSTPLDLLKFTPLKFHNRIRLGLLTLIARRVKNWKALEAKTAKEWLLELGGEDVYKVVWEPLLKGKFGPYAEDVSAVWFWNKLKLRGGSRGKGGEERLVYFKGSFATLAESLAKRVCELGGKIILNQNVVKLHQSTDCWRIQTETDFYTAKNVISTIALPLLGEMIKDFATPQYINKLNCIKYIGNVCLVLELKKSLSETYWLNVNDPTFPFVGVIEHTNFEKPETYNGSHIVYLSKYLPHTDELYSMDTREFLEYSYPYLKRMFPKFEKDWILNSHLWRARWSQPVVEKFYSNMIPNEKTPYDGLFICSMAQIYPEDRGTNYAIREGRRIGKNIDIVE